MALIPEGGWGIYSKAPRPDWGGLEAKKAAASKPLAQPSAGLRKLFNDSNWKVPDVKNQVGMPQKSFDLGQAQALKSHTYTLEAPEWQEAQAYYGSESAESWGWGAPVSDDKKKLDELEAERTRLNDALTASTQGFKIDMTPVQNRLKEVDAAIKGLEAPTPKITEENYTAAPLTWEAYNALPSEQRTAVDYNTLLIDAREKDLAAPQRVPKYLASPQQAQAEAEYDAKVKEIFGEMGGSEVYAPRTVALLDNLGITAKGQDLDEYLGLDRAITSTELVNFKFTPGQVKTISDLVKGETLDEAKLAEYATIKAPENLAVLDTQAIQAAGENIKEMLSNPELGLWSFESAIPGMTGQNKQWKSEEVPLGYGSPELRGGGAENPVNGLEIWLNTAFEHLKSSKGDPQDLWDDMKARNFTAEDTKTFFEFMDTRLRNEEEFGEITPPEGRPGTTRSAKEIRQILGWEK